MRMPMGLSGLSTWGRVALLGLVLPALAGPTTVAAEELAADRAPALPSAPHGPAGTQGAADADAVARGPGRLELTLRDALERALGADLALSRQRLGLPVAHQRWIEADAGFDRLLTAGVELRRDEQPSTSTFFGSDAIRTTTTSLYGGVSRRLRTGGEVSLMYRADRIDTSRLLTTINPAWQQGIDVGFRVPLGRGAGWIAEVDLRRAQNGMAAARADEHAAGEQLLLAVMRAYWELAYTQRDLEARWASEAVAAELLADVQARIDAEVATPLDAAEARAGLERRRSDRYRAAQAREDAADQLLAYVRPFRDGSTPPEVVATDDPAAAAITEVGADVTVGRLVAMALAGRPELRALAADVATRGLDVKEAQDALRPDLDLIGSASTVGFRTDLDRSLRDMAAGEALSMALGVEFSLYVGQRAAKARWRAAGWARQQSALRMRQLENEIVVEVRRAHRALATAKAVRAASEAEVLAAAEALEGERQRLKESKSTPFRVLEKEDELTAAQTRRSRALVDARVAEAGLWRAVGALSDRLGLALPSWPSCVRCITR